MDKHAPEYAGYEKFPDGRYLVTYNSSELNKTSYGPRLILWFAIMEGEHCGEMLPYWCPMKWVNKSTEATKFTRGSKYEKLMRYATDWNGKRRDRCPPSRLKGLQFEAEVVTVTKRGDGSAYSDEKSYSKIEKLVKL